MLFRSLNGPFSLKILLHNFKQISFSGEKSGGKLAEGYPSQSSNFKLLGRYLGLVENCVFRTTRILRLFIFLNDVPHSTSLLGFVGDQALFLQYYCFPKIQNSVIRHMPKNTINSIYITKKGPKFRYLLYFLEAL